MAHSDSESYFFPETRVLCSLPKRRTSSINDQEHNIIYVFCTVKTEGKTGVEMEALTGVQITLLTIYDMCKAIDKHMVMSEIHLVEKTGGKSGAFRFQEK